MNVLIAPALRRRRHGDRRGAAARPVHLARLRRAGEHHAAAARKLRRILDAEDLIDGSHDSKAAIALFDSFPKGELFAAPFEDLRARCRSCWRCGPTRCACSAAAPATAAAPSLVAALPRERYSAALRERLREMVAAAYGTDHVEQHEVFGEDDRVHLHLTVDGGGGLPDVDVAELERRLILEARTWGDRVAGALVHRHGPSAGGCSPRAGSSGCRSPTARPSSR